MKFTNLPMLCVSLLLCSGSVFSSDESLAIETEVETEILAEGLNHPWSVTFISADEMLVTELSGDLRRVSNGRLKPDLLWVCQRFYSPGREGYLKCW